MIRITTFAVMIVGTVMLGIVIYVIQAPSLLGEILTVIGTILALSGFVLWQFSDKLTQRYNNTETK